MARLDELERKFEENPRRYFAPLANEYRKAGEPQRAAELCRSQLSDIPGHISGHIVLGQALFDSADFAGSRAALETALALDPENIVALRYLGDIASSTGDSAEAERWYSRTLEADPYNEAATVALAALRESAAKIPVAEEAVEPAQEGFSVAEVEAAIARQTTAEIPAEGFEPTAYSMAPEPANPDWVEPESVEPVEAEAVSIAEESLAPELFVESAVPSAEDAPSSADFAGDLEISAASELAEEAGAEPFEVAPVEVAPVEAAPDEAAPDEAAPDEAAPDDAVTAAPAPIEATVTERFDVEAHAPADAVPVEETAQSEERVMEAAAPFVTETMADLYMEQGYPHEALELLLQLSEQRPQDHQLRAKIEHIESVIVARRDTAVAAARAERAEASHAAHAAESSEPIETATPAVTQEPPDAPLDAAVAEVDSTAFAAGEHADVPLSFEIPFEPAADTPVTVREMFARMDRVRPRPASAVTPRPLSRLRSDFVPMPESTEDAGASPDDPFAFPNAPPLPEDRPPAVPRSSGPQPAFNPSTAETEDFDAWLRGLKGP